MAFHYSSQSSDAMNMSHSINMASYPPLTDSTMKEMTVSDTDPVDPSGEKKRNRLGYARTNMACGNCRKRKIRCLLVKHDGRCTQCIRLKKNCQFYAVDQEPLLHQVGAGSRAPPQPMLTLSRQLAPYHPGDMQIHHYVFHGETAASHDMTPTAWGSDAYLDHYELNAVPVESNNEPYGYGPNIDDWTSMTEQGNTDINTPWRGYSPKPTAACGYDPYSIPGSQAFMTWPTAPVELTGDPEDTPRPEDSWSPYPQPTRSMSFSGEHLMQYDTVYDERRASVASEFYRLTNIEAISQSPYTGWQQPYQP
ncbi:hypothetical protein GGS21DRAFT_319124 [Xylaria nigripes]|nr:hypothetical protein GGS21DRAFT_319124 [Xylaria nigripes]